MSFCTWTGGLALPLVLPSFVDGTQSLSPRMLRWIAAASQKHETVSRFLPMKGRKELIRSSQSLYLSVDLCTHRGLPQLLRPHLLWGNWLAGRRNPLRSLLC